MQGRSVVVADVAARQLRPPPPIVAESAHAPDPAVSSHASAQASRSVPEKDGICKGPECAQEMATACGCHKTDAQRPVQPVDTTTCPAADEPQAIQPAERSEVASVQKQQTPAAPFTTGELPAEQEGARGRSAGATQSDSNGRNACQSSCSVRVGAYVWPDALGQPAAAAGNPQKQHILWVGPYNDSPALTELLLTLHSCEWHFYDPASGDVSHGVPESASRRLMRRMYLVDRAKKASIVGLLVGTLGGAQSQRALQKLRQLAKASGKKTYTVLMGKPNPAKLANFLEVCSCLYDIALPSTSELCSSNLLCLSKDVAGRG